MVERKLEVKNLKVVMEHPELWQLLINGKEVSVDPGAHWLDRKFGVYNIGQHIIRGENRMLIPISPISSARFGRGITRS